MPVTQDELAVGVPDVDVEFAGAGGQAFPDVAGQHGDGELTWILIEDAARRGLDTRVGLEDTLCLPDGGRARNNADLVTAARLLL